ncbi:Uncharacterised protein [uncultured archaeon]|nr:Uncharacterised protein [uncultured archaeon]
MANWKRISIQPTEIVISINGHKMISRWDKLIGSSNPLKKQKINQILSWNISSKPQ